ncbi:hypothetical protein ACTS95_13405 [Empedobacter brevis]
MEKDCSIMKFGKFSSLNMDNQINELEINDSTHLEKSVDGKYWVRSTIRWTNNCEFELTIKEMDYPDFPFVKGEKMFIKIDSIVHDKIYYKAFIGSDSVNGIFRKLESSNKDNQIE